MPAGGGVREPGLTLRMVAQAHGAKFQIAAALGAWCPPGKSLKEGLTLTRLLRAPMEGRTAGVLASLQGSQAGKELEHQWETGLQQATAVSGHLLQGAGGRLHHSVFILPVASRPSLVAQPGQPVRFQGGSLQVVEGRVPSSLFWRVVNHVRPDLSRPPAYVVGSWISTGQTKSGDCWSKPCKKRAVPFPACRLCHWRPHRSPSAWWVVPWLCAGSGKCLCQARPSPWK